MQRIVILATAAVECASSATSRALIVLMAV